MRIFVLFLLLMSACGAGPVDVVPPSDRTTYPQGPYGEAEGDVLAPLSFVSVDDDEAGVADVFADADARVLVLSTAAGWCGACVEEMPALQALVDERPALRALVAVFEDEDARPADAALAQEWQEDHDVAFSVVADPPFVLSAYYDEALTPMNMVVDVDSMTIARIGTGFDEDAVAAVVDALLREKGL